MSVFDRFALYILSAPVEEKGYKRIIIFSYWRNGYNITLEFQFSASAAVFISQYDAPFTSLFPSILQGLDFFRNFYPKVSIDYRR